MAKKEKAKVLLYNANLAESIEQGERLIMAGLVFMHDSSDFVDKGQRVEKAGQMLPVGTFFEVKGKERFVSRGAYKLLTGLEHFSLDVRGLTALDAGASTGGFTDCLLQNGAVKVYTVDVGRAQLHEKIREDSRVVSFEGVNMRLAPPDLLGEKVDLVVADLSFISLTAILPSCMQFLKFGGMIMALIKPQFELGSAGTEKGVVRDDGLRQKAVNKVLDFAREELGLELEGVVPSALKGPKGNQEYLALWHFRQSS